MKRILICAQLALALTALPSLAGTLDDAPFKITVPDKTWALDDTTEKPFGQTVSLVAVLASGDTKLKSVVMKTTLADSAPATVAEYYSTAKDTLTQSSSITDLTQVNDTFAGLRVRHFTYQITQNNQTFYNETVVFVSGKIGWSITCIGPTTDKDSVTKMLTYFSKKP